MQNTSSGSSGTALRGISSMATRQVLAELCALYRERSGQAVEFESVGGVDAARRVAAGEAFDLVVLARDAIDKLMAQGALEPGSRRDLVLSGTSVAVPRGAPVPDISSEAALREAVLAAPSISYSTGPSGVALAALFARWGIAEQLAPRIITPPPGTPVGSLVARGEVALGFQQLSELIHVEGITVAGPMPAAVAIDTVFSGAAGRGGPHLAQVQQLLDFMTSPEAEAAKRRQGMLPA